MSNRFLTVKDLQISKLAKRVRFQPCSKEFERYLSALADATESKRDTNAAANLAMVGAALARCVEAGVSYPLNLC